MDESWNKVGWCSRKGVEGPQRKPRSDTVHREVWGVQSRRERKDRSKGKPSAKKEGERGRTLKDVRVVKIRDRNENVFARLKWTTLRR